MSERILEPAELPGGYEAIGVARGGELCGGALYTNFRSFPGGGSIEIWAAGHDWLSRRIIRILLGYPFLQLDCHRATALTLTSNATTIQFLEGLGFVREGVARQAFGPGQDVAIYGMLRDECRWIAGHTVRTYNLDA